MNIGDLNIQDAGSIPMTINTGLSIHPEITTFSSLLVGIDHVDIASSFTQDQDVAKRLRYGAELQLFDNKMAELSLRAGMYQAARPFEADVRLATFLISGTMFSEEVGAIPVRTKTLATS
jgi:hypothetical protein